MKAAAEKERNTGWHVARESGTVDVIGPQRTVEEAAGPQRLVVKRERKRESKASGEQGSPDSYIIVAVLCEGKARGDEQIN